MNQVCSNKNEIRNMLYDFKIPNVGDKIYIMEMDEYLQPTTEPKCEVVKEVIKKESDNYQIVEFESGLKIFWNNIFLNNLSAVVSKKQHVMENVTPFYCTCPDHIAYGYSVEDMYKSINCYKNSVITRLCEEIKKMNRKIKRLQKKVNKKEEILKKIDGIFIKDV